MAASPSSHDSASRAPKGGTPRVSTGGEPGPRAACTVAVQTTILASRGSRADHHASAAERELQRVGAGGGGRAVRIPRRSGDRLLQAEEVVAPNLEQHRAEAALRHEALNDPCLHAEPARLPVLRQLAEENDALAAHGSGDTRGRLFLQAVGGGVHTQAARWALGGRFHPLRSAPGAAERQTAEQQGAGNS